MSALGELRARETERIRALLPEGGLVLVYGPDAQEAVGVASAALTDNAEIIAGELDIDGLADDQQAARAVVRAAAAMMLGDPRQLYIAEDRRSGAQQRAWLDVYRAFSGLDLPDLLHGGWPAEVGPPELVATAISALGSSPVTRPVLAVGAADALLKVARGRFSDPEALLWAMRSAAQGAPQLTLLLSGGPAAIELIAEREEAFYGWGRPVELRRLDTETLADAVSEDLPVDRDTALLVAELSEGLPRVARLLARWLKDELQNPASGDPARAAWKRLLDDQASSLRTTSRLLGDLHRLAMPVCQALATGRPPYTAGHSGAVTRALKVLKAHGICESPQPRKWRLTDPLLAAWLSDRKSRVLHHRARTGAS